CRLCCSHAAMGARTTVPSRGTARSKGQVMSWNFMRLLLRASRLLLMFGTQLGILLGRMAGVNSNPANGGKCMAVCRFGARQWCPRLLVLAAVASGCNPEDAERMARVGRKVTARAEALTADQDGGLNKGLQAVRNGWQETTLAGRVAARLRWDKQLTDCQI